MIQIVVGPFASVTKNLEKWLESWTQELVFQCPPKNYSSRNRKDFKNSISQFWGKESKSKGPFSWVMTRSLSKYNGMRSASAQKKKNNNNDDNKNDNNNYNNSNSNLNDYYNTYIVNNRNRTEWSQETT